MVRLFLFILGATFTSSLYAQEWFPVGASWYYNQILWGIGESYTYFEVTGEIDVQGKNCKVISGACSCGDPSYIGYFYQAGDQVYVFDGEADSFKILYDFSLVPGDTMIYKGSPSVDAEGYFVIDSITYFQAGAQSLRVQHFTSLNTGYEWGNMIIERIGANGCLYPMVGFCDPATGGLRCYEDDEIGFINFQTPPRSCWYTTGTDDLAADAVIKIYPNPATTVLHIESERPIEQLVLYNNLGVPVYQQSAASATAPYLEIHTLPTGLYHVQIFLEGRQIVMQRVAVVGSTY